MFNLALATLINPSVCEKSISVQYQSKPLGVGTELLLLSTPEHTLLVNVLCGSKPENFTGHYFDFLHTELDLNYFCGFQESGPHKDFGPHNVTALSDCGPHNVIKTKTLIVV